MIAELQQSDSDAYLGLGLEEFDVSTRAANCLKKANVNTIGDLIALRPVDVLTWPNAGRKTLAEIRTLLGRMGLNLLDDQVVEDSLAETGTAIPLECASLEDQLYGCIKALETERNAEMLMKLWGWNGKAPRTLESVGKEYTLTRERVRQIEKRTLERLRKRRVKAPLVAKAIDVLKESTPDVEAELGSKLQEIRLSRAAFCPRSLQRAAENLCIEWPFEFVDVGDQQILSLIGEGDKYRRAISILRAKTSQRGCVNVLGLGSDLQLEESRLPGLRRMLDRVSGVEWLDTEKDWVYLPDSPRNRLLNLCSKVLSVAGRIHLSELRRAVSRSRRLAMCPPQRVLGGFVEACGVGLVENSIVRANVNAVKEAAPAPSSTEGIMLRVLDQNGPLIDGEVFAEKCIAAGMNATTFYIYRLNSPVICSLGKNVYCKVGADVAPGAIEDIVGRRRARARASDYGWTSTGKLWCGMELTRQVITSGGVRLPSFVSNLVQGEWRVVLPDGSEYGAVICREIYVWSFRKPLALLGAEPTDFAVLEFDLKSRQVFVKVGGPGLFDEIQDSSNAMPEDGFDEARA